MSPGAWALVVVLIVLVALGVLSQRRRRPEPALDDQSAADADDVGVIAIEDAIDLHGFQPREIPEVVESYLEAASERGLREVRLIHGRGKGVQRQRVQEILSRHPLVERYADAPAFRGGWGATIAWLRVPDHPGGTPDPDDLEPPAV